MAWHKHLNPLLHPVHHWHLLHDHVETTRAINRTSRSEALCYFLGEKKAHALLDSPVGDLLLRINEVPFLFEPNRYFTGGETGPDLQSPAIYKMPQFEEIMLNGPHHVHKGHDGKEQYRAWYTPAKPDFPTIAYCHGNSGTLDVRKTVLNEMTRRGFGVMIVSYPGFKGSKEDSFGKRQHPSMQGCHHAAEAMFESLQQDYGLPVDRIIPFGESMGGAVALHLMHEQEKKGVKLPAVVTLNTFFSIPEWIREHFPHMHPHVKNDFNSAKIIGDIRADILLLHGTDDAITSYTQSERLKAAGGENITLLPLKNASHRLSFPPEAFPGPLRSEEIVDPFQVSDAIKKVQLYLSERHLCPPPEAAKYWENGIKNDSHYSR
jgi:alpha-beta hydrolase superfamily lysophospholipase